MTCVKILNQKHTARILFVVLVGPGYFGMFTEAQTPAISYKILLEDFTIRAHPNHPNRSGK